MRPAFQELTAWGRTQETMRESCTAAKRQFSIVVRTMPAGARPPEFES